MAWQTRDKIIIEDIVNRKNFLIYMIEEYQRSVPNQIRTINLYKRDLIKTQDKINRYYFDKMVLGIHDRLCKLNKQNLTHFWRDKKRNQTTRTLARGIFENTRDCDINKRILENISESSQTKDSNFIDDIDENINQRMIQFGVRNGN